MSYPQRFFDLNLRFARKVVEASGQPLEDVLLHYTNLYIRFGLGWDLAAANPAWREYLQGLARAEDAAEWTHRFYLEQRQAGPKPPDAPFCCFSYTLADGGRVRLHFHNGEPPECSPLSKDRMGLRLAELESMFAHIRREVSAATSIIGASWLYNLEAYRRLFPPAYLATAQLGGDDFAYLPLWGQFVDHAGRVKEDLAARFLECLDRQRGLEGIEQCFPYQVLHLESPIQEFYSFYGV